MRSCAGHQLVSIEQFEAVPWCPTCGQIDRLTSAWAWDAEAIDVLLCGRCFRPLVAL